MSVKKTFKHYRRQVALFAASLLFVGLPIVAVQLWRSQSVEADWYDTGWSHRLKLTINESQIPGTTALTNFPVLISNVSSVRSQVNSSADDAEENTGSGAVTLNSTDLEITTDGATSQQVGIRFTGITVPQGATIANAYILFTGDEEASNFSAATSATVYAEAADNASTYTTGASNISGRTKTSASVSWNSIGS